jgi:hypothetical protein
VFSPHGVLAELTEFLVAIENGTCARDEKARVKSKQLGNLIAIMELARAEIRRKTGYEDQNAVDLLLEEARRVLTVILERLASPMQ